MKLTFDGDLISVKGRAIRAPWKVADARLVGDRVVALAGEGLEPPSLGLVCYGLDGSPLWEAQRWSNFDPFVAIDEGPALKATTWGGVSRLIDVRNGESISETFVK